MTKLKEMVEMTDQDQAYAELVEFTELGNRFHGGAGIDAAADWLEARLGEVGLTAGRMPVALPGWEPGEPGQVRILAPWNEALTCWPMLWSTGTEGSVRGRVTVLGDQGFWGDSQLWKRLSVVDDAGEVRAYLHVRDKGPAAPQPLPTGSDDRVAHLSISQWDGQAIIDRVRRGEVVEVEVESTSRCTSDMSSDNVTLTIPGTGQGRVLVCAHYDAFWNTPGAYDNASGTLALLGLARSLAADASERTVDIAFFTGEEWHLGGSRRYATLAEPRSLGELDFVLNIDGLGDSDHLELASGPEQFEQAVYAQVREGMRETGREATLASRFPPTRGTDDASFAARGVPTAFITFNNWHKLHQPDDTPNPGIARNIAWTTPIARRLIETLERPQRLDSVDFL